jgi:hypothetical protein
LFATSPRNPDAPQDNWPQIHSRQYFGKTLSRQQRARFPGRASTADDSQNRQAHNWPDGKQQNKYKFQHGGSMSSGQTAIPDSSKIIARIPFQGWQSVHASKKISRPETD